MKKSVAVVGSCVSRDVFNSRFTSDYKKSFTVADTIYQVSLPSLMRENTVEAEIDFNKVRENYKESIRREFIGNQLARLAIHKPDVLVFDLFSDIHFGVTCIDGKYVTRNHMAMLDTDIATCFYDDEHLSTPHRVRFDGNSVYQTLASTALVGLDNFIRMNLPDTKVILNSARYAVSTNDSDVNFNINRLTQKNRYWDMMDELFLEKVKNCGYQITHAADELISDTEHPWGTHPVHYIQDYYEKLLNAIVEISETD